MALTEVTLRDGNGSPITVNAHVGEDGSLTFINSPDSGLDTYRYATLGYAPVAAATVIAVVQGSASRSVRVRKVRVHGIATAAGNVKVLAYRANDAGTLGSAVLSALTAVKGDSAFAAAGATVSTVGTANYGTPPANDGTLAADYLQVVDNGTQEFTVRPVEFRFGDHGDSALVLTGAAERLCLSLDGSTIPTGCALALEVETTEEDA